MAHPVAQMFLSAAQANFQDSHRQGNVVHFQPGERLIVAGDIHGHRVNFTKIVSYAGLGVNKNRHLVLQEIIHGGPVDSTGGDRSFELLMRAANLKLQYPEQVHFLMGNHDLAEITGNEITKEGQGVCKAFILGLRTAFGEATDEVGQAIVEFFLSLPLACRCPNGTFISHSLPSPDRLNLLDPTIWDRPYRPEDLQRGGSVYELVWGRRHDEAAIDQASQLLGASLFICGHQPQECGGCMAGPRQMILASEHSLACIAEFDADQTIPADGPLQWIKPIAKL